MAAGDQNDRDGNERLMHEMRGECQDYLNEYVNLFTVNN